MDPRERRPAELRTCGRGLLAPTERFPSALIRDLVEWMATRLRYCLALMTVACAGCSTALYADMTQEVAPCEDPSGFSISDVNAPHEGPSWWTATCAEEVYFCSVLHERPICSSLPEGADLGTRAPPLAPAAE